MGIGVLSGAYSSIFIATPVLTHWKEREPAYRARRQRLIDEMGHLPKFPEENVVAKLGDHEAALAGPGPAVVAAPEPAATATAVAERPEPEPEPDDLGGADGAATVGEQEPESAPAQGDGGGSSAQREQRRKRQSRRRRKHGRHR
jgi:SecD/SecF fusion protein